MIPLGGIVLGATGWTAAEYVLHRFLMHEMRGKGMASREHLDHHADIEYFAPNDKKAITAAASVAVILPSSWKLFGKRQAVAITTSFVITYLVYEFIHRRAHTHPPKGPYSTWVRKNHFFHHFGEPMRNHGVTTPLYDTLFRTNVKPDKVIVPRRMAMRWLVDDVGEVKPEFANDYELAGSLQQRDDRLAALDRAAAYANRIPVA